MFSRVTRHLADAWKCQFKIGLGGKYRVFCYLNWRGFAAINGLLMEDTPPNTGLGAAALVAVCQMNSTNDVNRNLGICKDLVKKAKSRGAKVRFSIKFRGWGQQVQNTAGHSSQFTGHCFTNTETTQTLNKCYKP